MWHFEKIIDRKIGLISQIKKVKEELEEYKKATSVGHTIEEFWDSLNALEQIGIRLEEIYGTTAMIEGLACVRLKCQKRGNYVKRN